MVLWCLIEHIIYKFGFEKRGILTKLHYNIKHYMDIFRKGLLYFYQETSFLINDLTNHRTNMCSPYLSYSCYELDYECICIVINGKTRSVPLNILSSVYIYTLLKFCESYHLK